MSESIKKMDAAYRNKHYPAGSVFEKATRENRKNNIILAVMAVLVSAGLGAVLWFLISLTMESKAEGDGDSVTIGVIFSVVVGLILLLCVVGFVMAVRHVRDGESAILRRCAKRTGLTEEELREFDRQAMQSDSDVVALAGKVSAAMTGQKEGILTRDYLWLGDAAYTVVKRKDLAGVSLYLDYYYVGKKRVQSLCLAVVSKNGTMCSAETREDVGRALMAALGENSSARINQDILKAGKEFDAWRQGLPIGGDGETGK